MVRFFKQSQPTLLLAVFVLFVVLFFEQEEEEKTEKNVSVNLYDDIANQFPREQ